MGREFAVSGCAPMTSEHPGVSIVIMKVDHGESTRRPNLLIGRLGVRVTNGLHGLGLTDILGRQQTGSSKNGSG